MADAYLDNTAGGTPASPYNTYGVNEAHAFQELDLLALSAGDTIWVGSGHSETIAASVDLDSGSGATPSYPQKLLCVSDPGTNTALVNAPSAYANAAAGYSMRLNGQWYVHGISWELSANSSSSDFIFGNSAGVNHNITVDTSKFVLAPNSGSYTSFGPLSSASNDNIQITLNSCVFGFKHVGSRLEFRNGQHRIHNLSLGGGFPTSPTTLFSGSNGSTFDARVENSDLSGLSFTNLFDATTDACGVFTVRNVKLPVGCVYCAGTMSAPGFRFILDDCTIGLSKVPYYRRYYSGEVKYESTILPNTVSDRMVLAGDSAAYHSIKLEGSANASYLEPLYSDWMHVAIDDTSTAITLFAEILVAGDGAAALNNNQVWIEADIKDTPGIDNNQAHRYSDAPTTVIAAASVQDAGTISWTGHGYSSPRTHRLELGAAVTPKQKGYSRVRIALAANTSIYVGKVGVA